MQACAKIKRDTIQVSNGEYPTQRNLTGWIPLGPRLIFSFVGSVLVCGREQLLLYPELRVSILEQSLSGRLGNDWQYRQSITIHDTIISY
jgi:hypothetical protein